MKKQINSSTCFTLVKKLIFMMQDDSHKVCAYYNAPHILKDKQW